MLSDRFVATVTIEPCEGLFIARDASVAEAPRNQSSIPNETIRSSFGSDEDRTGDDRQHSTMRTIADAMSSSAASATSSSGEDSRHDTTSTRPSSEPPWSSTPSSPGVGICQTCPSSTLLGWSGALAVGAAAEETDDRGLEFAEGLVEGQAAPWAFGSAVRRWSVTNRCAAVTSVVW